MSVATSAGWRRLHPLSPLVRAGRGGVALLVLAGTDAARQSGGAAARAAVVVGLIALGTVMAVVSWLVTRWRVEDGALRIESGVLRRDSRRVPLARLQAIDVVRPLLGRMLGLAELRLRLAGSHHGDARLAYLRDEEATALRARLLALAHGLAEETPAPPEAPLLQVPTPRLIASVAMSSLGVVGVVLVLATMLVGGASPPAAGTMIAPLIGVVTGVWRRVNAEFEFTVAEAPDGLRLRAGLLETRAETIPYGRIQAVRMVEPLLWRLAGWQRLEVDVAGQTVRRRGDQEGVRVTRALLPVGSAAQVAALIGRVAPGPLPAPLPPPRRARWKSPLSYHFLGGGVDARHAVTQTGRVRRAVDIIPLAKVQSIRWVQGPLQRSLGLATLHLDTAGRNVHAVLRERDLAESGALMAELPVLCRTARQREVSRRG